MGPDHSKLRVFNSYQVNLCFELLRLCGKGLKQGVLLNQVAFVLSLVEVEELLSAALLHFVQRGQQVCLFIVFHVLKQL